MSTQNEPLNTLAIQKFIQQVKVADASKSKDLRMTLDEAKNLAFTLGIVMSRLEGDLERLVVESKNNNDEVIKISMDGGTGWQ